MKVSGDSDSMEGKNSIQSDGIIKVMIYMDKLKGIKNTSYLHPNCDVYIGVWVESTYYRMAT